ncbi:MAG: hypothetical protein J6R73_02745 [Alistipes sp.]|nr:hypothetical protein [Alistipes sp.]
MEDYIVIIAIVIAFVASTYNDAQKRRRRARNTPQQPEMQPAEKHSIPVMPTPSLSRPKHPLQPQQELPAEVRAAMEYARQRAAKKQRTAPPTHSVQTGKAQSSPNKAAQAKPAPNQQQGSEERFDLERAVIYSEILQPKYKEYE